MKNWVGVCLFVLVGCYKVPVTGRNAFILISEKEEQELGRQAYAEELSKSRLSSDTRLKGIVQRVSERIAAVAGRSDFQWEFRLLESPQKNAFCLPGGKIAVYTGILPVAETEAGLAVIVGHEVAHAIARHAGERITLQFGTQIGFAVLQGFLGSDTTEKKLLLGALGIGAQVGVALPFSRKHEKEADDIGLTFSAQAGYEPSEGSKLWRRMNELSGGKNPPTFLSSHPANESREKDLQAQLPRVQPLYEKSPKYGLGEKL